MLPANRSLHVPCVLSNTTHPCLLSSSGSGPVELEHKAQFHFASGDFTLTAKTEMNKQLFLCSVHIISAIALNRKQVALSTQSPPPPSL